MSTPEKTETVDPDTPTGKGMKILFLSSDTGGGHRASAESLAKQFQLLYPGSTYILHDMVKNEGTPPYSNLVNWYQHLSANPSQWKLVFDVSNSKAFEMLADAHLKLMCERAVRRRIVAIDPDVVISVHPLMCNVPVMSCAKISQTTGKHLPMFTVVTDLGSAHCLWFANGVEKMFVGSEQCWKLAQDRGKVPDEKLVMAGLPIRHDFAVQSEALGDRMSPEGKAYQLKIRKDLDLSILDRKTILVMGGGEGVGSLSNIVNALYAEFTQNGVDALILVVCGRNEKLKNDLESRDWQAVLEEGKIKRLARSHPKVNCSPAASAGCIDGSVTSSIRKILSSSSLAIENPISPPDASAESGSVVNEEKKEVETDLASGVAKIDVASNPEFAMLSQINSMVEEKPQKGNVTVSGLGFVTRMAEYMVAADVLVTKAGPGTISEAAAVSLPVMLTSYLPGQEEGNVDFVVEGKFGSFASDRDPIGIAEELTLWLRDDAKMAEMSKAAKAKGAPYAARNIAQTIGDSTLKWKEINEERLKEKAEASANTETS